MRDPKTFMLDKEIHAALRYLSAYNRRTISEEIEEALQEHFRKFPEAIQFFKETQQKQ